MAILSIFFKPKKSNPQGGRGVPQFFSHPISFFISQNPTINPSGRKVTGRKEAREVMPLIKNT
jgi:hypothetical protein